MRHLDEHLDDGIIHALLDGELSGDELAGARAHVLACEACSARVAEERLLAGEAERLIAELDEPAAAPGGAGAVPPPPGSPTVKGPPVVLIPADGEDLNSRWQRRRGPGRGIGIAATIAIAAGAGFFALQGSPGSGTFASDSVVSDMAPLPPPDDRAFALTDSGAAPTARDTAPASPVPLAAETSEAPPQDPAPAGDAADVRETSLANAAPQRDAPAPVELQSGQAKAREDRTVRAEERTAAPAASEPVASQPSGDRTTRAAEAQRPAPAERDEAVASVRQARPGVTAGAASASQDARRSDSASVPAPSAASAPAPRRAPLSLEQQAQISMRIGLDEAQRLLGGPMHVIDGLQPEFVGLVPGRLVRGANPSDYVVRVVYLDDQRRMIFLDQQRLDLTGRQMGMQRDTIPPEWVKGDVRLSLSGNLSTESARALARRVR
jgi:hypothetical protein